MLSIIQTISLTSLVFILSLFSNRNCSGVQVGIKVPSQSCEQKVGPGDTVTYHYNGTLMDGTLFDSSYSRDRPFTFTMGAGQVIPGMEEGMFGMCLGEIRKMVIPPNLAYGSSGVKDVIPGDATIVFDVDLLKIVKKSNEL